MFEFKLRNTYEIDYDNDKILIKGDFWAEENNGEVKYIKQEMNEQVSITDFKKILKIWILSEQGENKRMNLSRFGITHFRYDFDNRYIQFNSVQIPYGEAYIMFEVLTREINTDYFSFIVKEHSILIHHIRGYLIITDDYCRESLFFTSFRKLACSNIDVDILKHDNIKNKHKIKNELSVVNWYETEYTSFCIWVTLGYRDMSLLFSFNDLKDLLDTCKFLVTYYNLREDGIL